MPRVKVYLLAVKNQKALFFSLSPVILLSGVIQRSNKIIMDDKQTILGRQSVSLPNFFVAENIVHYLPNFVATWNPPFRPVCRQVSDDEYHQPMASWPCLYEN